MFFDRRKNIWGKRKKKRSERKKQRNAKFGESEDEKKEKDECGLTMRR
jgi:hypothetical protein